jgi:hypothetical protein
MKLLVHASGYQAVPPYRNEQQEILCTVHPRCGGIKRHWAAANIDFAAAGSASGGSSPAGSIDELLDVIQKQAIESIEELRLIAHANDKMFCLAGEVRPDDVYFTKEDAWIGPSQKFKDSISKFHDLQDRFTSDARIVLAGCNAASGTDDVMSIVSHAFLRKVWGFKEEILHKFIWGPTGAAVKDGAQVVCFRLERHSHILRRCMMAYSPAALEQAQMFHPDEDAAQYLPPGLFKTNVWELDPDASTSAGDIFAGMRSKDAVFASGELVWRILQEFYPSHPWVSGTGWYGVDRSLSGLKVRKKGQDMFIDAGPDFAGKTTPRTLKNRVAEVDKALQLVKAGTPGTVPLT